MKKVVRDGKVAVLYSPGFGSGWSTYNPPEIRESLCMDERIVLPMLEGNRSDAIEVAEILHPDIYTGGGRNLEVEWVPVGTIFEITEYDGSESVRLVSLDDFMVA